MESHRRSGIRGSRIPARCPCRGGSPLRGRLQRLLHGRRAGGRDGHLPQRGGRRAGAGTRLLLLGELFAVGVGVGVGAVLLCDVYARRTAFLVRGWLLLLLLSS